MQKIPKYNLFEVVSTTLDFGFHGPGWPVASTPSTITSSDTSVIYIDLEDRIYSYNEYEQLYANHLKSGGRPLEGFNKENLLIVLGYDE